MTLNEIAKKFPVGGLVKNAHEHGIDIGILLALHEGPTPDLPRATVAWYNSKKNDFDDVHRTFIKFLEPYGEIEAVKTLIDFAGRLLETDLGKPDREKLEQAIATCEGAFGI